MASVLDPLLRPYWPAYSLAQSSKRASSRRADACCRLRACPNGQGCRQMEAVNATINSTAAKMGGCEPIDNEQNIKKRIK